MSDKKHISVQVDRELWLAARIAAARRGVTLADVVRQALADFIAADQDEQQSEPS